MEFPFNHNHGHHHSHHRRDDDDGEQPPVYPPPGNSYPPFNQPPPPQPPSYGVPQPETHVFHSSHVAPGHVSPDFNYSAPPPPPPHHHQTDHSYSYSSAPAPPDYSPHAPSSGAHHVAHQTHGYSSAPAPPDYSPPNTTTTVHHVSHETHHTTTPHFPNTHVSHVSHHGGNNALHGKPTFRVITKAEPNFALSIRNGQVILARSDPRNEFQHWYKDEKYSTRVKDEEGCPAFSLINKATGEALKHSIGASHPVQLIPYNPDYLDESILWTESRDLGDGHRAIRMVNNVHLNVDAYHGDKHSGGVHDGTTIVLWQWNKGDNQRWKIIPY